MGGIGSESARADFNFRELPCYLSNPCETLPPLPTFIGEEEPGYIFVKDVRCCHGNQIFDAMFSRILTFLTFFLLINIFLKTNANSLYQSQEIGTFS